MLRRCSTVMVRLGTGSCGLDRDHGVAQGGAAEAGDQCDAEPGGDQGQVGVELDGDVGDARQPAGAVVHPVEPLAADACPRASRSSRRRAGRADATPSPLGERVVGGHDRRRRRRGPRRSRRRCSGTVIGTSPQLCTTPTSARPVGDQVDGVPRLVLGDASASGRGARAAPGRRRGRPGHAPRWRTPPPQVAARPCRPSRCRPLSIRSSSVSSRSPSSTRRRPEPVRITPRPTRSSSGSPTWRSSRLTCCETALGVKPSASAAATDRAVPVDRAQRDQGVQINHEAMLPKVTNNYLLVLPVQDRPRWRHEPA